MTALGKIVAMLTARHRGNEVLARGIVGSDGATYNTVRLCDGRVVDIRTGGYCRRSIGKREAARRGLGRRETFEDVYADGTSVACTSVYCGKREDAAARILGALHKVCDRLFTNQKTKGKLSDDRIHGK